jgi:hypothetical protein
LRQTKPKKQTRLAHTAPPLALCHPQEPPFSPFHRLRPFVPLSRQVKKQTAGDGRKGKTMKLLPTNRPVPYSADD